MDGVPYAEKIVALQKMTIENFKSGMDLIQSQTDDMLNHMLSRNRWMPKEYRAPIEKWQGFSRQELNRARAFIDDVFSTYEALFVFPRKQAPPKTRAVKKNEAVNEKQKMEDKHES